MAIETRISDQISEAMRGAGLVKILEHCVSFAENFGKGASISVFGTEDFPFIVTVADIAWDRADATFYIEASATADELKQTVRDRTLNNITISQPPKGRPKRPRQGVIPIAVTGPTATRKEIELAKNAIGFDGVLLVGGFFNADFPDITFRLTEMLSEDDALKPVLATSGVIALTPTNLASNFEDFFFSRNLMASQSNKVSIGGSDAVFISINPEAPLPGNTRDIVTGWTPQSDGFSAVKRGGEWYTPEPWGVWTKASGSEFELPNIDYPSSVKVMLSGTTFTGPRGSRKFSIKCGPETVAKFSASKNQHCSEEFTVSRAQLETANNKLSISAEKTISPASLSQGDDERQLAILVDGLIVSRAT